MFIFSDNYKLSMIRLSWYFQFIISIVFNHSRVYRACIQLYLLAQQIPLTIPLTSSSSSSSSDTVQGSVSLPHYRTLEVRPGRIS